jgi:hypothetical protein
MDKDTEGNKYKGKGDTSDSVYLEERGGSCFTLGAEHYIYNFG